MPAPADYHNYRNLLTNPNQRGQGMEFEGLNAANFETALRDERTARLAANLGGIVPLAIPAEHLPWLNQDFTHTHAHANSTTTDAGSDFTIYYINHFPKLYEGDRSTYTAALAPVIADIADGAGALVLDHPRSDALVHQRDLSNIAQRLGYSIRDVLSSTSQPVQHYHYASPIIPRDPEAPAMPTTSLYKGYQQALAAGTVSADDPVKAHARVDRATFDQVWEFYQAGFGELDESDPVRSGFTHSELADIFEDERYVKVMHHARNGLVKNLIIVSDVRDCDWLNQEYYHRAYPEQYAQGRIITSPGIIAADKKSLGLSMGTVGMMRKLIEFSGRDAVITFACDEASNQQVPGLAHAIFNRGKELVTDLRFPQNYQLFGQYHFATARAAA